MFILIPHQNFSGDINFSVESEVSNYELKRAYSSDIKEYAKIPAASKISFDFSAINSGTQALLIWSKNYSGTPAMQSSSSYDFSVINTLNIASAYGTNKKLVVYSNQGSLFYRINPIGVDVDLKQMSFGRLYNLPNSARLENRTHSYKYELSEIYFNLLGEKRYSGFENQGMRRSHNLDFEYLSETDKNTLIDIFTLGRGCLPVWYIDDPNDATSWMLVKLKELNYSEPYAGYFNVSISMEEF
jgi:hypothetical protein